MKKEVGKSGENIAEKFLRADRYKILEKNYRTRIGEIDIVAEKDGELAIIEVKTRTSQTYGLPQESVTRSKLARLRRLTNFYLAEQGAQNKSFRIDVISIQLKKTGEVAHINHIKNV